MRHPIITASWLLWGALLFFIGLYTVLATFVLDPKPTEESTPLLTTIFFVTAGLNTVVTFGVRFLLRRALRAFHHVAEWAPRFLPYAIVIWALSEAIAIYGLVLFLIGGPISTFLIFAGWAAILMVIHQPRFLMPGNEPTASPLDYKAD